MDKQKVIEVLDIIIADCKQDVKKQDVKDFDGRVFDGKTLGELHGIIEAKVIETKIEVLAEIIKELVKDNHES